MIRLEIKIFNMKKTRKAAKISTLLSGKVDKNEYLTGEKIVPSDQIE